MKTTKRFENAVMKLYNAFHENRLESSKCTACAVGNILNGIEDWPVLGGFFLSSFRSVIKDMNFDLARKSVEESGYSVTQLRAVENIFMDYAQNNGKETKETQFKGLCAVIEYLCKLDNIPNPLDYTSLFETENDKPIKELQEAFQ